MNALPIKNPSPRQALRKQIKAKYGSIQSFAFSVGISAATVSLACSGYTKVNRDRAERWAKALGCPINDIFPELVA